MFWEKFNRLCNSKGITPNGVAKELGIPSGSVTDWKKGRIPRSATQIKIADYFGVSVAELNGNLLVTEDHILFYEKLNELCRANDTTPTALCKSLGLSTSYPTGWKNGRRPRLDTVEKIARHFNVPVTALLDDSNTCSDNMDANCLCPDPYECELLLEYRKNPSFAAIVDAAYSAIHPQQAEDVSS